MLIVFGALCVVSLQQDVQGRTGYTSPPNGDTVGYWQQRVAYTITATLDERAQKIRARGVLRYVNNSPDTLREMFVHQYLNAFRPGSRWSEVDDREGRERFQRLQDPDYGYERFTAPVRVNGTRVDVDYPGEPDSTVARFVLPTKLAPHDSVDVAFEWDARPSTIPRRQGRRGRQWDLAQWYPKVAVYDRGGWEPNALRPAGELYGEFGTYDVTLVVLQDQVIGATGVPVSGDPGWSGAIRDGTERAARDAYTGVPLVPEPQVPAGYKAVRFVARDVHHFAWSVFPGFRYEGGVYARELPRVRWPTWDTISVHALYRPGDDTTWGGLRVVRRTTGAMRWLESIYGQYAYPQVTALHRLDGGATEFPMMMMNGSPSQGLILHEAGHIYTYGSLANNEWRSGWMDEGLTSYQTDWAQHFTPQEILRDDAEFRAIPPKGYRSHAIQMALPRFESIALDQTTRDLLGSAQPIGTVAHDFRDFNTYNSMIYDRAQVMYGQLRDILGDSLFVAFLHDYYGRWALKHVDERAMRASAERVSGKDLGWFFDQWVHGTGVMDYRLGRVTRTRDARGNWVSEIPVVRRGQYRHQIAVGVRTRKGWTLAQVGDATLDRQTVRVSTADEPLEARLDPFHFSWDWDRRNDVEPHFSLFSLNGARGNFDWPFLDQADRDHEVLLFRPMAWYSDRGGGTYGLRLRSSYLGLLDQTEIGAAVASRSKPLLSGDRLQYWWRMENPYLFRRPLVGWRAEWAWLDDIYRGDIGYRRQTSSGLRDRQNDITLTYTDARARALLPELWRPSRTLDLDARTRYQRGSIGGSYTFVEPRAVVGIGAGRTSYGKFELAMGRVQTLSERSLLSIRLYGGVAGDSVPAQRALFLSAADPVTTFGNHWWRPAGSILKQPGVNWLPLGGAALRGYRWDLASDAVVGGNLEASHRIAEIEHDGSPLGVWVNTFADVASTSGIRPLSDAGVGLSLRGRFYDRDIVVRLDSPFFVNKPSLAIDRGRAGQGQVAPRWAISFNDIW